MSTPGLWLVLVSSSAFVPGERARGEQDRGRLSTGGQYSGCGWDDVPCRDALVGIGLCRPGVVRDGLCLFSSGRLPRLRRPEVFAEDLGNSSSSRSTSLWLFPDPPPLPSLFSPCLSESRPIYSSPAIPSRGETDPLEECSNPGLALRLCAL